MFNYKLQVLENLNLLDFIENKIKKFTNNLFKEFNLIKEDAYFIFKNDYDNESLYIDMFYRINKFLIDFEKEYIYVNYDINFYKKCRMCCNVIVGNGGDDAYDLALNLFELYCTYFDKLGCLKFFCKQKLFIEINDPLIYCKMLFIDNCVYKFIRISPYCNKKQTSFVKIHFYEIYLHHIYKIMEKDDIIYQVSKASGAGGQHVNKTESKVKAIHKDSGIFVVCSETRSQIKNREIAFQKLQEKIKNLFELKKKIEKQENYSNLFKISWANFRRIINLHKENFIKDNISNVKFRIKNFDNINLLSLHNKCFYADL